MAFWSRSLVSRLIVAMTVLSLFTVAVIGIAAYTRSRQALAASVFERLELAATLKEDELTHWIEAERMDVDLISRIPDVPRLVRILDNYEPEELEHREAYSNLSNLLIDSVKTQSGWTEAMILSPDSGQVILCTDKTHEGAYRVDDEYFQQGRRAIFVQSVYLSPVTLQPAMTIAAPILDQERQLQGVLVVHINLDYLNQLMLERTGLGETGEAYLVDRLNTFVSAPLVDAEQFSRGVHTEGIDAAVQGQDGQGLYENYEGEPVVGVYHWIDSQELALMVEMHQEEAFASANALGLTILLTGLAVCVVVGIIANLLARQIAHPILAIHQAVSKVAAGDLDQRAPVITRDEVGVLANAFNQMTSQVQDLYSSLQRSEEYFRSLIENASDLILVLNNNSTVRYASPSLLHLMGYPPEDWVGKTVLRFIHPEDYTAIRNEFRQHPQNTKQVKALELRALHRDGSWRVFEALGSSHIEAGVVTGIIVNAREITERRQMEDALRQSEQNYRLVFDHALQGILVTRGGQVLMANPVICQITGYTLEEMLAFDADQLFGLVHPDDLPLAMENFQKRSQGNWNQPAYQLRYRRKDGGQRWVEATDTLMTADDPPYVLTAALDITERKEADTRIRRQFDHLAALHAIDIAISSSHDQNLILHVILDQVMNQLNVDAAAVLLLNEHTMLLEPAAGRGLRLGSAHPAMRIDDSLAGTVVRQRQRVSMASLQHHALSPREEQFFALEGFAAYHAAPLVAKGQVRGVLEIFHRKLLALDDEGIDFLETLAGQTAIALDNTNLFNKLQRSNLELALAYDATIEGWSRALDLRDRETEGHTLRVTEMTLRLARALGINDAEQTHIRWGALLHDIGKMGIPDAILHKPGPLDEDEWQLMRQHPRYAWEMLASIEFLRQSIDIPYCHHEHWDGTGYPRGLKGEQIPLAARIFSLADNWDALLSDRPYRTAWPQGEVYQYLRAQAGTLFDPQIAEVFLQMLARDRGG